MAYLLDSNIFIESRKNLPMDVWVTFWSQLSDLAIDGQVVSSVKVKEEIAKGYDELSEWIKNHVPSGFFLSFDSNDMVAYTQLQNWVLGKDYTDTAKMEFAANADAYIIATAYSKNLTLVTFEKSNLQRKNRVMIPDACAAIGASCCDLNTMLRAIGITI